MRNISDVAEFDAAICDNDLVIAKFQTQSCVICRRIEPGLKAVTSRIGDTLDVVQVDAQELEPVAERYGVKGVPTLILFKDGAEVSRCNGFQSTSMLNDWLAPHV